MITTVVISMLIVISYHIFIATGCSKFKKNKRRPEGQSSSQIQTNGLPKTPPLHGSRQRSMVQKDDGDSVRTKAGTKKKGSKEQDSTDDAFKDMAARLAKKETPDKTADSLLGDDDENPIAGFQMPERPVVDASQDGAKLENIVQMEKKPVTSKPKRGAAGTPVGPPATAKERSMAEELPKSKKSKKSVYKSRKVSKVVSRREDAVMTDKTQSEQREPRGKGIGEVEKTQLGTVEDGELAKTQMPSIRTVISASQENNKKKEKKDKSKH